MTVRISRHGPLVSDALNANNAASDAATTAPGVRVAVNVLRNDVPSTGARMDPTTVQVRDPFADRWVSGEEPAGRRALTAKRPMTRVGRAIEKGETQGFMKITVDADTREILGEMGYAGAEIDRLGASGVVGCYGQST